jgi:hypothetical protein
MTSPKGAGKTEAFSGKSKIIANQQLMVDTRMDDYCYGINLKALQVIDSMPRFYQ